MNGNLSHIHNCSIMSGPDISFALICDAQHNTLYNQAKQALPVKPLPWAGRRKGERHGTRTL